MTHSNEKLIIRYFEEAWNAGNLDVLDEIIASDYINHSPGAPNPLPGPEGLKPIVAGIRKGFSNLHYEIQDMVVTDDKLAVFTIMTGTHDGDFFGIAPTNKSVNVRQMQIERIESGQIIEHWRVTDELALMKQLGQVA